MVFKEHMFSVRGVFKCELWREMSPTVKKEEKKKRLVRQGIADMETRGAKMFYSFQQLKPGK